MKFDTIIIALVLFTIVFLISLSRDYENGRSFFSTIQASVGFNSSEEDLKPEETLVAPFADPSVQPITSAADRMNVKLPVNEIPLDKPHRSIRHVKDWVTTNVGNALILDKEKISQLKTTISPSFTNSAVEQYKLFGKNTNIFSAVFHGENTTLASYLKEQPLLITSQPIEGIYQWKFEVLAVLSLVKDQGNKYNSSSAEQQTKEVYFCITVKRFNDANEDGLLISDWKNGQCQ